jgi:phosphatidylglycerophosphate synthase
MLLAALQRGRYTPRAWGRFFADSWRKSRQTAKAHPSLARSWARVSVGMGLLGLAGWAVIWLVEGQQVALRVLPTLALCLIVQQSDVFVHLGLNRAPDGRLRGRLGLPTTLTLIRGTLAGLLVAHLLRGVVPPPALTLGLYLPGVATDLLDGPLARRTSWTTRLGGYLDGEADFYLFASVTLCTWLAGRLPGWFALAMLLRFVIVIAGAIFSYFVAIRQVDFRHTIWGRLTGTGQALCLIVALLPISPGLASGLLPLLLVTLALAVLAPIMGVRQQLRFWKL